MTDPRAGHEPYYRGDLALITISASASTLTAANRGILALLERCADAAGWCWSWAVELTCSPATWSTPAVPFQVLL